MQARARETAARRRDRWKGLAILVASFGSCMALSLWAKDASIHDPAPPPLPPTVQLPGFPKKVRPFEALPVAEALSIRPLLQGFLAEGVEADGSLDFSREGTALRFSFQSLPGRGPQPNRVGGTLPTRSYCGRQNVRVSAAGMVAEPDRPQISCSHGDPRALPVPDSCDLPELLKTVSKQKSFSGKGTAEVEYFWAKAGPAFRVSKKDAKRRTQETVISARDCQTIFTGGEQRGSVPP